MTVSTDEQMNRPLFEEPTSALERAGSWEGAPGFMVGGMANLTFRDIAEQYFDAASLLSEKIRNGDWEDHRLANPVLYLYRHSIELFIKAALVGAPKTHDLDKIVPQFRALHKSKFGADLADWINHRLKELAAIDPITTAFRYSQNYDKAAKKDVPVTGEFHVDLLHLQSVMAALRLALVDITARCLK